MRKIKKDKPGLVFSVPNLLTYARIIAVPLVALCFYLEGKLQSSDFARWSALAIFAIASLTDFFDGYLARIWKQTSNIGRMLDPEFRIRVDGRRLRVGLDFGPLGNGRARFVHLVRRGLHDSDHRLSKRRWRQDLEPR